MKYLSKIIIAILILNQTVSLAQNAQYEIFDKSYVPNSLQTELQLVNNFGNINLVVWEKNSIQVTITLDVEGYDEKEVKKILEKIDLKTAETAGLISVKTNLKSYNSSSRKKTFKINYQVKMPDGHPLSIDNEFGNIFLTDYSGKSTVNLEYGNLIAGNLKLLNLSHEFGKGEIESIEQGKFNLSYVDGFSLHTANQLQLTAEFSKVEIKKITSILFDLEYGNLSVEEVSNYDGEAEFSGISIGKVHENFELDAEYANGTIEINLVSKDIKSFQLSTEFSKSEIRIESGANFTFESEHSFGKLKTEGSSINFTERIKDMSDESYRGTIGNQTQNIKTTLKIDTEYGGCTIIAE
ncbi:hypothetical protein SAMN05661096_02440 [Marivirga sericea]|uniref:Adhesin n=1 Tax=Marivirga sericea TaxID=1028 RepID=A0A1X7K970_9BACT|nr:hypothetical protein [Marivirga sericea]SMG37337.1 hypothetical protein SAMN05661096_02440 [Marivirga sericea]